MKSRRQTEQIARSLHASCQNARRQQIEARRTRRTQLKSLSSRKPSTFFSGQADGGGRSLPSCCLLNRVEALACQEGRHFATAKISHSLSLSFNREGGEGRERASSKWYSTGLVAAGRAGGGGVEGRDRVAPYSVALKGAGELSALGFS